MMKGNDRGKLHICATFGNFATKNKAMTDGNAFDLLLMEEAKAFIDSIDRQAAKKIYYNIARVAAGERDKELFKKLEGSEIWEFRTLYRHTAYRLLAFWDKQEQAMVVATHGFVKKTQKTPAGELARARRLMKEYFENKGGDK